MDKQIEQYAANNYNLPSHVRPILQLSMQSKILIIGPAPGIQAHKTGIPWNDRSGEKLRSWLSVTKEEFYDKNKFALISMNFWFPGYNKHGGDNPPNLKEAELWHRPLLKLMPNIKLILLVGKCAQIYYLKEKAKPSLTDTVRAWREYLPKIIVLPHPSWHNNSWINNNVWFKNELLPVLQQTIKKILKKYP